jgi:clan AA aspartic protease (TIGR02281 family)
MGKTFLAGLLACLLAVTAAHAGAEIYRWVDSGGVTHATSDPDRVPAAYRGRVQTLSGPATAPATGEAVYSIPFERGASGVMFVQVWLDDTVRARMVFDTGASLVLVSEELARRLGPSLPASAGERVRLKTAGGEVYGKGIVIGRVDLDGAVKENVRAAVSLQKQVFDDFDGLLGLSFLEDFLVTIDHQNREIVLRRPPR